DVPTATQDVTGAPVTADGVHPITCDPEGHRRPEGSAVTVLAPGTWGVGGWSHASGDIGLAQEVGAYRITTEHAGPDPTCDGVTTLDVVLAKKLVDWDRQHLNGMEARFPGAGLTFADVTDLVLELRLRPEQTVLPTTAQITAALGGALTAEQVAGIDDGRV